MRKVGRRPGSADTRAEIVAAARACFMEEGYEKASLRGIARRAGVDAALIHHYFDGKPELFMSTVSIGRDPAEIFNEVRASPRKGETLIRAYLREWEPAPGTTGPSPFVTTLQAVCSSREAARAMREFLSERVWSRMRGDGDLYRTNLTQSLVTSQLWGIAVARYVLRLEPLVSATVEQVAEWYGPVMQATFDMA
jgi:AcrR family transcriptional regulator